MIPSGSKSKTIICEHCGKKYTYIILNKITCPKRFCDSCIRIRKNKYNEISRSYTKENKIMVSKKIGRPSLEPLIIKLLESKMVWDEVYDIRY